MNWVETLYECWNILNNELIKKDIDSIDKFMYYIFTDLFLILNKHNNICDYEDFIKFEDDLEKLISKKIQEFKQENKKNTSILKKNNKDKTNFINILQEKYIGNHKNKQENQLYKYFYYSNYLNEAYIYEKLKHMDESKYPVLKKYLDFKVKTQVDDNNFLDNLNLFNITLNLINEKYSNKI